MNPSQDFDPTLPRPTLTQADITHSLCEIGIRAGERLIVHSSLSSLGWVEGGAATVIAALLEVIGPQGTLVMPYSLPYVTYQGVIDLRDPPPPVTGTLTACLRTWPGARLSPHPSHAVVALGPAAAQLTANHHRVSPVGRDSPFDRLARMGGKILLLGVNQRANTTIHTGEAYAGVAYWGQPRPNRPAGLEVILPHGQQTWLPLPELPGDSHGFPNLEPFLDTRGLITWGRVGRARCRLMAGQALIEAVVEFLAQAPGGLLCQRRECTFCPRARQYLAQC